MTAALKISQKYKTDKVNSKKIKDKQKLVLEYAPLVKTIAKRIAGRLPPNVNLDDLISAGIVGLMDAIEKWDPQRQTKLRTYAEFRIKGAILDELRNQDWISRTQRDRIKFLEKIVRDLEQDLGRSPSEQEIAQSLNMSLEEYQNFFESCAPVTLISLDEQVFDDGDKKKLIDSIKADLKSIPENLIAVKKLQRVIRKAITNLPEKYKMVISLHYYEELNFKEVAEVLGLTESRVSQIHKLAIINLKNQVNNMLKNEDLSADP